MNNMSGMGLKKNDESFIDGDAVKTQMTKEEILKAEKEKIEKLKIQLKENGMDDKEIENQIKQIMEADKINKTREQESEGFSEPVQGADEDISSVRRALNV